MHSQLLKEFAKEGSEKSQKSERCRERWEADHMDDSNDAEPGHRMKRVRNDFMSGEVETTAVHEE